MKRKSLYIIFMAFSIALLLSGCTSKSYLFDFTIEPDLSRSDGIWATQSSNYSLEMSIGLILKGIWAAAPHFYNGDFEVKYVFEMKEDASYYRQISLLLASEVDFPQADWWGGLCISDYTYDTGDFHLFFWDRGALYPITVTGPVDDILVYPGENTALIKKRGNVMTVELNDISLGYEHTVTGYSLDWFCPAMNTYYEAMAPWDLVIYKSLEVLYKGRQVLAY